jgi:hypothetical protein
MLLIYGDEHALDDEARDACYVESAALCRDLASSGNFIGANPLQLTHTATSVRMRAGKRVVTDGPFAETREQFGGYFLVDARDRDEAIEIAARIPGARWGTVEVRPIYEIPGIPEQ